MEKFCAKCKTKKDESEFSKNRSNKDGISDRCKECEKQRAIEYRLNNPENQRASSKRWRSNYPERQKEIYENYIKKNPHMKGNVRLKEKRKDPIFNEKHLEQRREYYKENVVKLRAKRKDFYYNHKTEERARSNKWKREKMKSDPIFRIKKNLRDRIRKYMKGESIGKRTFDIIGLNPYDFKIYIESKFVDGMTWKNYGKWHIDHKQSLCQAKTPDEILKFNHYTNLQPLWAEDNLRKNRKYGN
jgi:hypothetical protein